MYPDTVELDVLGLTNPEEVWIGQSWSDECTICGAPPLSRYATVGQTMSWLFDHDPDEAARLRAELSDTADIGFDEIRSRCVNDSLLSRTIPIPLAILENVSPRFSFEERIFLGRAFSCAVCERCIFRTVSPDSVVATLLAAYLRVNFDGNMVAARAQPSWALAQRIVDIVAAETRRSTGSL